MTLQSVDQAVEAEAATRAAETQVLLAAGTALEPIHRRLPRGRVALRPNLRDSLALAPLAFWIDLLE